MRIRLRAFRRLVPLALPCWLLGGPLATTLQSVAACPHHEAMPSSMHHGTGSDAPCWCPDMAGASAVDLPTLPAATLEPVALITGLPVATVRTQPGSFTLPPSPSFAPTPPPPDSLL